MSNAYFSVGFVRCSLLLNRLCRWHGFDSDNFQEHLGTICIDRMRRLIQQDYLFAQSLDGDGIQGKHSENRQKRMKRNLSD